MFTAVYGDGYRLWRPPAAEGVAFVCFTDQEDLDPEGWQVVTTEPLFPADPTRSAREKKLLAHRWLPEYERSLYVDPSVELTADPRAAWDLLTAESPDAVLGAMLHSFRETVLDEFVAVMRDGLESEQVLREHLQAYVLTDPDALSRKPVWSGMIARRHLDPECVAAMDRWFSYVLRYSRRDQLSLPSVLARMPAASVSLVRVDNAVSGVHRWPRAGYARPARYFTSVSDDLVPAVLRSRVDAERRRAAEERIRVLAEECEAARAERDTALAERDAALVAHHNASTRVDELVASSSWRITAPLRSVSDTVRWFRGGGAKDLVKVLPPAVLRRQLRLARYAHEFQISADAMRFVRDHLPPGGSLLVFGVGHDSTTWAAINRRGRTAFLEDQPDWRSVVGQRAPHLELHEIAYTTTVEASGAYVDVAEIPVPHLPDSIGGTRWDAVVVDGPMGHSPDAPGRASSIALAARLVAPGGWVLVDDMDRALEQRLVQVVFGRSPDLVIDPGRPVAAFRQ